MGGLLFQLEAVVFDFDGVLNRNYDRDGFVWSRNLAQDFGIDAREFAKTIFDEKFRGVLSGEVDLCDIVAKVLPSLGCNCPAPEFLTYWFERDLALCDEMLQLVADIKSMGASCFVGTNNERHRATFIWDRVLTGRVDGIFASGPMGVAKPDPGFFNHIQSELKITDPSRLLLIDDMGENVTAAKRAGWRTIQYGDFSQHILGNPAELRAALGLNSVAA